MDAAYEKLGAFYLGGLVGPDGVARPDEPLLYDARDLTTHAVCVGMTGSGKTGLCLTLLEEAAIDGVPAIAIDMKGDLGNLLLTFPELRPEDFTPWVDPGAAATAGITPDELAAQTADQWREGLADWHQQPERIARFRDAVDITVYTPGSSAGLPLSILGSLAAPPPALQDEPDALWERVRTTVTGLLGLLGVDADPLRSREHILLSQVIAGAWREHRDLDLGELIRRVQKPPFAKIGVMDLESVFPADDRQNLALRMNNLLASPGFAAWMEGEPLDIARMLHTPEGKPRLSIVSVAHLPDAGRMFIVTLLLNELVAWMRAQSGTSSLRAVLFIDEVMGYLPPTAKPPSKAPLLTLLKQARAFGVGVVLATQNPVDIDYKALSNAGTWFLGRLQTERDKARVLAGLERASATAGQAFDRSAMEATLAGLGRRVFLMNNVHEDHAVLFHTRWLLSYLRGPLTRDQIAGLMEDRKPHGPGLPTEAPPEEADERPTLPADVPELFIPAHPGGGRIIYRPALLGAARLHFVNANLGIDVWEETALLAPLTDGDHTDAWEEATVLADVDPDVRDAPEEGAAFATLPPSAASARSYTRWQKALKEHLYRTRGITIRRCRALKLASTPGESEGDFLVRLRHAAHEERDRRVEKLRKKYAARIGRLEDRIRRAEEKVDRETAQYEDRKTQSAVSLGSTLLGALFGRKLASVGNVRRAAGAARSASRVSKEKGDIARAERAMDDLQGQLAELEVELTEETALLRAECEPDDFEVETVIVKPRKADIAAGRVALAWTP